MRRDAVDEPVPDPVAVRGAVCSFAAVDEPVPEPVAVRRRVILRAAVDVPVPEPDAVFFHPRSCVFNDVPVPEPDAVRFAVTLREADDVPVPEPVAVRCSVPPLIVNDAVPEPVPDPDAVARIAGMSVTAMMTQSAADVVRSHVCEPLPVTILYWVATSAFDAGAPPRVE